MSYEHTKQVVSVYNYPEHLNPFYGDEQHKRIRFWKINGSKKDQNGSRPGSRRGSFNLGSLKDLLSPFGFKKRASTQSVNKTSESPPLLRRDFVGDISAEEEFKYSSYDPHFRHTISPVNFQRDAAYRSSLQNVQEFNLGNRNSRYRSTVQYGTPRFNNGRYAGPNSSVTPTPTPRFLRNNNGMTPGSSMNSVCTNPFEDEYDRDSITIASGSTAVNDHRRPRKTKRRAPLPPVSPTENEPSVELRIEEPSNGLEELSRLTAEFQNFVKSTDNIEEKRIDREVEGARRLEIVEVENRQEMKQEAQTTQVRVAEEVQAVEPTVVIFEKVKKVSRRASESKADDEHDIVQVHKEPEPQKVLIYEKPKAISQPETNYEEQKVDTLIICLAPERRETIEEVKTREVTVDTNSKDSKAVDVVQQQVTKEEPIHISYVEEPVSLKIHENEINTSVSQRKIVQDKKETPFVQETRLQKTLLNVRQFAEIREITPSVSREQTPDYIPVPVREKFYVLKIDEDELTEVPKPEVHVNACSQNTSEPRQEIVKESSQRDVEYPNSKLEAEEKLREVEKTVNELVAQTNREETPAPVAFTEIDEKLKMQGFVRIEKPIEFYENIETVIRKRNSLHINENEDEPPRPPERRRSVKDIIESINRNQKLLGGTRLTTEEKPAPPSKTNVLLKLQQQAENEKRIELLLADLQNFEKDNPLVEREKGFPCDENGNYENRINPVTKPKRSFPNGDLNH